MKPPHPLLSVIPPGPGLDDLVGIEAFEGWVEQAATALAGPPLTRPKAVLLAGLPGTGKAACTRALSRRLNLPLWHFDAPTAADHLGEVLEISLQSEPSVLWIDGLDSRCHALARWITLHEKIPGIVVGTTGEPHLLGSSLVRAGVFDEMFHLDLPDLSGRALIWDAVLQRFGLDLVAFDNVRLAQASGLFTPGEIVACVKRAVAAGTSDERSMLEPMGRIRPVGITHDEQLAAIRDWAKARCVPAG